MLDKLTEARRAIAQQIAGIERCAKVHGGVERFRPYMLELSRAMDLIDGYVCKYERVYGAERGAGISDHERAKQIRDWLNGHRHEAAPDKTPVPDAGKPATQSRDAGCYSATPELLRGDVNSVKR